MSETMNALAVTALGKKAELVKMPRPAAGDDGVVIKTWYSGVSVGTEMWIASGRRQDYGAVPFINGYQATGEVIEVGVNVKHLVLGDLAAVFCNGAHCEFIRADAGLAHKLPDPSIARAAALFVQPSVGANALNHASVNLGDNVLVVGQGMVGQCTAMLARLRGAYVVTSDVSPKRLEISARHCADWAINASGLKVSNEIKQRFPSGMDVVLESTGFQALLDDAMQCCSTGGRFVFEGWYPDNVSYHFQIPHGKQLRAFYPCWIGPAAVRESILRLMAAGFLDIESLISDAAPWKECEPLYNRLFTPERDQFNGIIIDWR